jgi:hypothetical protein
VPTGRFPIERKENDIMYISPEIRVRLRSTARRLVKRYVVVLAEDETELVTLYGGVSREILPVNPVALSVRAYTRLPAPLWLWSLVDGAKLEVTARDDIAQMGSDELKQRLVEMCVGWVTAKLEASYGNQLELPF